MFKDKTKKAIFHLAYPMKNKEETRLFYTNILRVPRRT